MVNLVKKLVDEHGWTTAQIAYRLFCSTRSVENWYMGKNMLPVYRLKLTELLDKENRKSETAKEE